MKTEKTLLIVDDGDFDRKVLRKVLAKFGDFDVVEARDGDRCLEVLDTLKVDLVLLDILMPGSRGTEVLSKIREKFSAIDLPVIMVTSKSEAKDVVDALAAGANDYLTKPIEPHIAFSRISTHLRLVDLVRESVRLKEIAALEAMIVTYNHEINSPLATALMALEGIETSDTLRLQSAKTALERISEIVKRIRDATQERQVEFEDYSGTTKMVKLKR